MIAFKTFNQCPENQRPQAIPLDWPWQEQQCSIQDKESLEALGFTVLSEQDYETYKSQLSSVFNAWQISNDMQKQKDYQKYLRRSEAKDKIIAQMATENMERVRSGIWTVQNLIDLTQDAELKRVLDDINTLSFELAQAKLMAVTNPIVTPEIKAAWLATLQANLFNNG